MTRRSLVERLVFIDSVDMRPDESSYTDKTFRSTV